MQKDLVVRGLGLLVVAGLMYNGASEQEAIQIITSIMLLAGIGSWTAHTEIKAQKQINILKQKGNDEEHGN